jgi:hypothetical protein
MLAVIQLVFFEMKKSCCSLTRKLKMCPMVFSSDNHTFHLTENFNKIDRQNYNMILLTYGSVRRRASSYLPQAIS